MVLLQDQQIQRIAASRRSAAKLASIEDYLAQHGVFDKLNEVLSALVVDQPENPMQYISDCMAMYGARQSLRLPPNRRPSFKLREEAPLPHQISEQEDKEPPPPAPMEPGASRPLGGRFGDDPGYAPVGVAAPPTEEPPVAEPAAEEQEAAEPAAEPAAEEKPSGPAAEEEKPAEPAAEPAAETAPAPAAE